MNTRGILGYKETDIDKMKFALNMASFYLPLSQENIKLRLEEIHLFLDGLLAEGHIQ